MDQFIGKFSKNLNTLGEKTQPRPAGSIGKPPEVPKSPVSDLSMGAKAAPAARMASSATHSATSDVNINGAITVQTQATDAPGIASRIAGALRNSMTVQQANGGLN